ncbi:ANTAR domain-containing protein [Streptomyces bathyalis]|uniref:ANTAR domain-containing protein n=1 Tax=Streptomyces bathyalis TaxID=2710756 RepID=A0A7T1WUH4_9ACTN|nr:ANTAR domain-containing protein [Streptomyces bathyalis]QPP09207.1 ANTAR domain-containing protein [Streptomyces bathyalis]
MDQAEELRTELHELRRAMETWSVIDLARGVLMEMFGCTAEAAWVTLRVVSHHTDTKLRTLAEQIIASTQGEPMATAIHASLHEQLRARGKQAREQGPSALTSTSGSNRRERRQSAANGDRRLIEVRSELTEVHEPG